MQAEAVSGTVVQALQKAAAATGSDFHYLLGTAMRESSLRPNATSSTSSATGLFQFIDQTWLGLVKEHGAQHGLGKYADANTTQGSLRASLGREVCGGELYAAHFLGPDAAARLIKLAGSDPGASAAAPFPQGAASNKSVFFHADGSAKSVREVYDWALAQPGSTGTVRADGKPVAGATVILQGGATFI